jgi:lysophospholipase L1-like esterase
MRQASKTLGLGLALLLVAGGAFAQGSFSSYVALGDSLTAGYASGGLAQVYQQYSYPALLAGQFGISDFEQPLVSDPGFGLAAGVGVLQLQALNVVNGSVVPTINPIVGQGMPLNATYPGVYNNLGIPGAQTGDLLTKTGDITRLATGQSTAATLMYDLILRDGQHTALEQAIGAGADFYTVWIGNNDVLGAATSGVVVDGVTLTPTATFQQEYTQLLGALRQYLPSAGIVVANIPDVTAIPFVTTVKPYLVNPADGSHIPLIGENGLLTENDYLTLGASEYLAQGIGIPTAAGGTGLPLPEGSIDATGLHAGVILRADEVAQIKARTAELNGVISAVAAQVGATVVDVNSIFNAIAANGYTVGGVTLTPDFLTGGIFSYDGVHPQTLGYAVVTNEFIKAINADFGANVPLVDLRPFLLGAQAATAEMAGNVVFSRAAFESVLRVFAPNATIKDVVAHRPVRRMVQVRPPVVKNQGLIP